MSDAFYLTAEICLNGHVVSSGSIEGESARTASFCSHCGKPVIAQCPACGMSIRGRYYIPGVLARQRPFRPPSFCFSCGKPFPWTAAKIQVAKELAEELDGLDASDRETLKAAIDDLSSDTPRTELAAIRFTKTLRKARRGARTALTSVVLEVASEAAKKLILGNGG